MILVARLVGMGGTTELLIEFVVSKLLACVTGRMTFQFLIDSSQKFDFDPNKQKPTSSLSRRKELANIPGASYHLDQTYVWLSIDLGLQPVSFGAAIFTDGISSVRLETCSKFFAFCELKSVLNCPINNTPVFVSAVVTRKKLWLTGCPVYLAL